MAVTFGDLKDRGLRRAEMADSKFVSGSELADYVNGSVCELHGLIAAKYEDYLTSPTPSTFVVTGSASVYQLPSDFLKLRGVDYDNGGEWLPLRRYKHEERGRWSIAGAYSRVWAGEPSRRYNVMGGRYLTFLPEGASAGSYRCWYVPRFVDMVADSEQMHPSLEPYAEYVDVDVAIKCKEKEETDTLPLVQRKAAIVARIEREASNVDASEQEFVSDVSTWGEDWL